MTLGVSMNFFRTMLRLMVSFQVTTFVATTLSLAPVDTVMAKSSESQIVVGSTVDNLKGTNEEGKSVELNQLMKDSKVLVYFYPKADTPGCTAQACSLRDNYAKIEKLGVKIIGVSTDSPADQLKFKQKHSLPFTLIADQKKEWAKAFDVPVNFGFASRQAFLLEKNKIIWLDRSASTSEQAADVIKFLEVK